MTPFPVSGEIRTPDAVPVPDNLSSIPQIVLGQTRTFHPDPYGAYAAGRLPTPFTGGGNRPYAVSSGAKSVDARADGRNFLQQKWDGVTQALDPAHGVESAIQNIQDRMWAVLEAVNPYVASVLVGCIGFLLLVFGAWAAIQGGK